MSQAGIVDISGGGGVVVETLTGNSGGAVPPTGNNINVVGDGTTINVSGNPGTSTLTISAIGGAFAWSNKSANFNAVAENGYFITGSCTATLPAAPSIGNTIQFFIQGGYTLTIQANTGQYIQISSNISAEAGTQSNTASGDACTLVYNSTGTQWNAVSFVGGWNT